MRLWHKIVIIDCSQPTLKGRLLEAEHKNQYTQSEYVSSFSDGQPRIEVNVLWRPVVGSCVFLYLLLHVLSIRIVYFEYFLLGGTPEIH